MDLPTSLSVIAILISIASAVYTRIQAGEAKKMRNIAQGEIAEAAFADIQSAIDKIRKVDDAEDIDKFVKEVVGKLKAKEITLGTKCFSKLREVIEPLWDAVNEKRLFLEHGTGKRVVPGTVNAPEQKLSELENAFRSVTFTIRNELKL